MFRAALVSVAVSGALLFGAPAGPDVRKVVERAGRWVEQFERDFISVVADEQYDQFAFEGAGVVGLHRQLRSELLFLRPEAGESCDRLTRALSAGRSDGRTALRRLADESARFNIGELARNFNTPTLALQFLDGAHRDRFRFRLEGTEQISGEDVWRLAYQEREHPTMIQANFRDTELIGRIWIGASDGAIVRTRLELTAKPRAGLSGLRTVITVEYAPDEKLNRLVPASMQEDYLEAGGDHRVTGNAVYSNYRVFETSARVVSPQ
jgi:hypothetical protein